LIFSITVPDEDAFTSLKTAPVPANDHSPLNVLPLTSTVEVPLMYTSDVVFKIVPANVSDVVSVFINRITLPPVVMING
jgi:hypothetical protein